LKKKIKKNKVNEELAIHTPEGMDFDTQFVTPKSKI